MLKCYLTLPSTFLADSAEKIQGINGKENYVEESFLWENLYIAHKNLLPAAAHEDSFRNSTKVFASKISRSVRRA